MVVAEPEATLLTACLNGYGKRTQFGPNSSASQGELSDADDETGADIAPAEGVDSDAGDEEGVSSSSRYRTQRRGGKGLRDIKTTDRNGPVIGVASVNDDDELLMMTARGKLQRMVAGEISVIGRNTQGVRIMSLDEGDTLAAIVRVPLVEGGNGMASRGKIAPADGNSAGPPVAPARNQPSKTPDNYPASQRRAIRTSPTSRHDAFGRRPPRSSLYRQRATAQFPTPQATTVASGPSRQESHMSRRALVTGITGQDGAYLAEFLLKQGYCRARHGAPRQHRGIRADGTSAFST